ncbi:MAG TPA: ABC transporter substrate-binding protein [Thermoanaerobaculia bacterium]|nr:ABC transporter substrate-binding protein [Thermoanaerobaculia bacterium]
MRVFVLLATNRAGLLGLDDTAVTAAASGSGDRVMDRRVFLAGAAALLAAPFTAEAQPAPKPARVALVCGARCEGAGYDAFRQGLRELGRVEGRNLVIDVRGAEGRPDRLPALVAELLAAKPDIIVAVAPQPARAAKDATSTIPIVFVAVADPIALGVVTNLARPSGNVTGLSTLVPGGFTGKMLELLKEAVPTASRIAVLWSAKNPLHVALIPKDLLPAAEALGVRLQLLDVTEPEGIAPAVEAAVGARAQALLVLGDPMFHRPFGRVPELALRAKLPSLYLDREVVTVGGGLLSYGPDFGVMFRRAAVYVDHILKGAKPGDLPIEQPTRFVLVINLKTAKALGLTIPQSLLLRADQVIE